MEGVELIPPPLRPPKQRPQGGGQEGREGGELIEGNEASAPAILPLTDGDIPALAVAC